MIFIKRTSVHAQQKKYCLLLSLCSNQQHLWIHRSSEFHKFTDILTGLCSGEVLLPLNTIFGLEINYGLICNVLHAVPIVLYSSTSVNGQQLTTGPGIWLPKYNYDRTSASVSASASQALISA